MNSGIFCCAALRPRPHSRAHERCAGGILNSYDDWSVVDYDGLLGWAKSSICGRFRDIAKKPAVPKK